MKYEITRFKSLSLALKEAEPTTAHSERAATRELRWDVAARGGGELAAVRRVNSGCQSERLAFTSQPRDREVVADHQPLDIEQTNMAGAIPAV